MKLNSLKKFFCLSLLCGAVMISACSLPVYADADVPAEEAAFETVNEAPDAEAPLEPVYYVTASGYRMGPILDYTLITESPQNWSHNENDSCWYVVKGEVTIDDSNRTRVTVTDEEVNLILCDGAVLRVPSGITVEEGKSLTIWAQSNTPGVSGELICDCQHVTSWLCDTGIGGYENNRTSGKITINGGSIYAAGCCGAAGIGGACGGSANVTINGGHVCAKGGAMGAGIGGGAEGDGGHIRINGGSVEAFGSNGSAAIGGGANGPGGEITIAGCDILAYGSDGEDDPRAIRKWEAGAGIGGGGDGTYEQPLIIAAGGAGDITIYGGRIQAYGGDKGSAAGIGCGQDCEHCGGSVFISYEDSNPTTIIHSTGYSGSLTLEKWFDNTNRNTCHEGDIHKEYLDCLKDSYLVPRDFCMVNVYHIDFGEVSANRVMAVQVRRSH